MSRRASPGVAPRVSRALAVRPPKGGLSAASALVYTDFRMLAMSDPLRFQAADGRAPAAAHAWREWVHAFVPGMRVQKPATIAGSALGVQLGPGRLWQLRTPAEQRVHVPSASAVPRNGFIALKLEGESMCVRGRREIPFRAGDLWMGRASDHPFATIAETPSSLLLLTLPWPYLVARHPQLTPDEIRRFEGQEPSVTLVRELMLSTLRLGRHLDPAAQTSMLGALVELCGAVLASAPGAESDDVRVARALTIIDQELHSATLCPTSVAATVGLSRRRLDELFVRSIGATVAARIAEVRLNRAAELLSAPANAHRRIGDIALALGFEDPAHFSRAFKARFRVMPKQWRDAARSA